MTEVLITMNNHKASTGKIASHKCIYIVLGKQKVQKTTRDQDKVNQEEVTETSLLWPASMSVFSFRPN